MAVAVAVLSGSAAYAACCAVPTTHQVRIPGVVIGQPSISQGCSSNCGQPSGCNSCGHSQVDTNITATATASATAASVSSAFANSAAFSTVINGSTAFGSSGSSFYVDTVSSYIPNLSVEAGKVAVSTPYSATRTVVKVVVIRAVCVDDKEVPHPASQVTPDKDISETYEGELFRCIAGTRLQYTFAEYNGQVSFDHGQTVTCQKGHALYHTAAGKVECRPQKPARDCNERSLLRRFGAGIKIVKIVWTETYTAYRTEYHEQASAMGMVIDGGVGGIAH